MKMWTGLLVLLLASAGCSYQDEDNQGGVYSPDTDPLVNPDSLFEKPPEDWAGIASDETLVRYLKSDPGTLNPLFTSSTGTHFDKGNPGAKDPVDRESCRPDFMVLGYPVISFTEPFTHVGSRNNFIGGNTALAELFSNEKQVTAQTPPTFLLHTSEDRVVPPQNSVVFYMALLKAGVPAELHIYEKGPHGVGLAKKRPGISAWPASCQAWLGERGFLKKKR